MFNLNNFCFFEGRVSKEPQYSTVQFGNDTVEKALFSIAVDRALSSTQRQKANNGDQSVKTCDFVPCSLLGNPVNTLRQWFPVGKAIKVVGHYTEYQTTDSQTGQKKYGHMFEIDYISFTVQDSKKLQGDDGNQQNNGGGYQQPQQNFNNNGYQQAYQQPQQNYQQPQQNFQQPQQGNFQMFPGDDSPF